MQLKYVDTKEEIIAINRKSKHIEPHLHNALEIVCVTSGSLLGKKLGAFSGGMKQRALIAQALIVIYIFPGFTLF